MLLEEGFQLPVLYQCGGMTKKCKYMFLFPLINLARKGYSANLPVTDFFFLFFWH